MNRKNVLFSMRQLLVGLVLIFALGQCANPIAPTGGPKDEQPPQIDSTRSTPNLQTNFRPERIELTFDEWVKLDQANQQVVISPPLQGYEVRLKGKTVILELGEDDTLRNNVTYVVQFGEAVKDLTESNPAEDLRFVFATGPYIDSLEVTGQVLDAYTAEPIDKALVMLYDNLADSVFRTLKPFYFGRTNEEGQFRISNLRAGSYKVTALEDSDANYRFNQAAERIAFVPEPLEISADTTLRLQLSLFREQLPLQLQDVDSTSSLGRLKLTFNRPPTEELQLETVVPFLRTNLADSILLWHQAEQAFSLRVLGDTLLRDTLSVPAAPISRLGQRAFLSVINIPGTPSRQAPGKPLLLGINRPVASLDTSLINLRLDTFPERLSFTWEVDSTDYRQLRIKRGLQENAAYEMEMLPGAVTDYWGATNQDTLRKNWNIADRKSYGNLTIRFVSPDSAAHYHFRLLVKGKPPVATFNHSGALSYTNQFTFLPPSDYQLEIIEDRNQNGRWDAGNYEEKRQPERVYIRPLETLRANWDLEADVDLGKVFEQ